jgi:hypothetical protein
MKVKSENGVALGRAGRGHSWKSEVTAADGRGGHVDAEVKVASTWIDDAAVRRRVRKI